MPHLLVFACGFLVGRKWPALKGAVAPLFVGASQRFDALYANAARTLTQTIEDLEDRAAERRYLAKTELTN